MENANQMFKVQITENGKTRILPTAPLTREDAEWEVRMQKRLQSFTNCGEIKIEIISA